MAQAESSRSERPLSPHLQVYRLIPTMVMSILHRLTGAALYFGTLILVWLLVAAATDQSQYSIAHSMVTSWLGLIVLAGYSWALIHHLLGGIRHLIWDTSTLIDKESSTALAWATIAGSLILTAVLWLAIMVI